MLAASVASDASGGQKQQQQHSGTVITTPWFARCGDSVFLGARHAKRKLQVTGAIIRRHPSTLLVPLFMLGIMLGVGLWGVRWGADQYDDQAHQQAQEFTDAYMAGYQRKVQQIAVPLSVLNVAIQRNPTTWAGLNETINAMMPDILNMTGVRDNLPVSVYVAPQGRVAVEFLGKPLPYGFDLMSFDNPAVRIGSLSTITLRGFALAGPLFIDADVPNPFFDKANPGVQPSTIKRHMTLVAYVYSVFTPVPPSGALLPTDVEPATNCTADCGPTADGYAFWGFLGASQFIDSFIDPVVFERARNRFRITAPNRNPQSSDIDDEKDLQSEIFIASSSDPVVDPVKAQISMDDSPALWTLYVSPSSGTWRPPWEVPMMIVVIVVSVALAAMQFTALVMWRQHGMLLESLLPQNVLQQLHNEHDFGTNCKAHLESSVLGTPAETMMRVLGCNLQGEPPDLRDVVLVRTTLMRGADVYRPLDLAAKIKAASGLDSDVAKALARELDGAYAHSSAADTGSNAGDWDTMAAIANLSRDSDSNQPNAQDAYSSVRSALATIAFALSRGETFGSRRAGTEDGDFHSGNNVLSARKMAALDASIVPHPSYKINAAELGPNVESLELFNRAASVHVVGLRTPSISASPLAAPPAVAADPAGGTAAAATAHHDDSPRAMAKNTKGSMRVPRHLLLDQLESQLAGSCEWGFDTMELATVSNGRPLSTLGYYVLSTTGLVDTFKLKKDVLARYLSKVESLYVDNPYHSATHAAGVLQCMHVLLQRGGLAGVYADPLGQLACYIAAVVHDLGHPGRTNDFLINTSHNLAVLYNDKAPLENHHVSQAFDLMRQPGMDVLSALPRDQRTALRRMVIELVLITDMKQHFSVVSQFKTLHGTAAAVASPEPRRSSRGRLTPVTGGKAPRTANRQSQAGCKAGGGANGGPAPPAVALPAHIDETGKLLTLQFVLKCADLGHLSCPLPVHLRWVAGLEEEYFRQGDAEKAAGLPASPLFDRCKPGITKSQVGFFNIVVLPLFHALASALPSMQPLTQAVDANYSYWQDKELERNAAAAATTTAAKPTSSPGTAAGTAGTAAKNANGNGNGNGNSAVTVKVSSAGQA